MKTQEKEIFAIAKYVRISASKVRRVGSLIVGKQYESAAQILKALPHKGAFELGKVLKSAFHNAVNNHNKNKEKVLVKNIIINDGPLLKRYKNRARGRIFKILKRTCHIQVIVEELGG
ncbi:50S ribosomal protein L22 [Candidatus Margulisiibacteriota bacterium]